MNINNDLTSVALFSRTIIIYFMAVIFTVSQLIIFRGKVSE
jgi:hypothetical protein